MKSYRVVLTENAKSQLKEYIAYILEKFKNPQAAKAVRDDARETKNELSRVAGSLAEMSNERFKGYRKTHFRRHNYVMIYHIENDTAYVDRIFHEKQDYENKIV